MSSQPVSPTHGLNVQGVSSGTVCISILRNRTYRQCVIVVILRKFEYVLTVILGPSSGCAFDSSKYTEQFGFLGLPEYIAPCGITVTPEQSSMGQDLLQMPDPGFRKTLLFFIDRRMTLQMTQPFLGCSGALVPVAGTAGQGRIFYAV